VTQSESKMSAAFQKITEALGKNPSGQLLTNPILTDLTAYLKTVSLKQTITVATNLKSDAAYSAMFGVTSGNAAGLGERGQTTTLSCASFTVSGSPEVPGIARGNNNFLDMLKKLGTEDAASAVSCAKKVTCNAGATSNPCNAGNAFMGLKDALLAPKKVFNCPLFEDDAGANCDPGTSTACLRKDGTVKRKDIACDLDEYSIYVAAHPQRITETIKNLDSQVTAGLDNINTQLRNLTETTLLAPIRDVANGVTCGFFGKFYREVVESICFQGVYGFRIIGWSYVSTGFITIAFIAMMFAVWRRTVDNYDEWEGWDRAKNGASPSVQIL